MRCLQADNTACLSVCPYFCHEKGKEPQSWWQNNFIPAVHEAFKLLQQCLLKTLFQLFCVILHFCWWFCLEKHSCFSPAVIPVISLILKYKSCPSWAFVRIQRMIFKLSKAPEVSINLKLQYKIAIICNHFTPILFYQGLWDIEIQS